MSSSVKTLFIFIDGFGIGKKDASKNPFAQKGMKLFDFFDGDDYPKILPFNGIIKPVDCLLGLPGLPQSATNQTALYTGINAAQILKKQLSGFPNQKLREILEQHSILRKMTRLGRKAAFINAYRPIFFELGAEALCRFLSVTSIMNWKAGLKFYDIQDLKAERCIYHDFTNSDLIKKGFKIPQFSPEKAGTIFVQASKNFDFCLYEYFKTDGAGHSRSLSKAVNLILLLEQFIFSLLKNLDFSKTTLIITSDHGNIEDLSLKTHTKNPVPLMVWGRHKEKILSGVKSILDISKNIMRFSDER